MPVACDILFEDNHHAVVLKPAGMAVHGRSRSTPAAWIRNHWHPSSSSPSAVHRLDYGTRGPVMVAKSPEAHRRFQAQWPLSPRPTTPGSPGAENHTWPCCIACRWQNQASQTFVVWATVRGVCMAQPASWNGPFAQVEPTKSEGMLLPSATPSWGTRCTGRLRFTQDMDFTSVAHTSCGPIL